MKENGKFRLELIINGYLFPLVRHLGLKWTYSKTTYDPLPTNYPKT